MESRRDSLTGFCTKLSHDLNVPYCVEVVFLSIVECLIIESIFAFLCWRCRLNFVKEIILCFVSNTKSASNEIVTKFD
jgi:hypothetical protein